MTAHQAFVDVRAALNQYHMERREEIDISLWATLSGFHVSLIGPPGTAKSMLLRDISRTLDGATYKELLMTKFTTPEELFGPWNIPELQNGKYVRILDRMVPEAHFVFLDEFFKANHAVQNTLLTIMNERIFHNGPDTIDVPLITLFAASNEMPDGEELWALFDRFHFRKVVGYIKEPSNFVKMLQLNGNPRELPEITFDQLHEAQKAVYEVDVPDIVQETLVTVRDDLGSQGIIASDRRYLQAVHAMKASAWLEGRDYVDDDDFKVLIHMMWTNPGDVRKVERLILEHTNPLDREVVEIQDQADEIAGLFRSAVIDARRKGGDNDSSLAKQGIEWFQKIKALANDADRLSRRASKQGASLDRIKDTKRFLTSLVREIGAETIGTQGVDILGD